MALLLLIPLSFLSLAAIYLLVLAGMSRAGAGAVDDVAPCSRFAVVVPAHDEETTITGTLQSLKALAYPSALFDVVVIADNCTDRTAHVAVDNGVRCLERNDSGRRGKGYALQYAFSILLRENYDAFVVVDADTIVDVDFLVVMNARLARGDAVLQSRYGVTNPDETPLAYMLAVGNVIENDLFLKGRHFIGFPAILRGNGMCFSARVLREHPWDASSVVEDTEYSLSLLHNGIDVRLVPQTGVNAPVPSTLEQARSQRIRWSSGNSRLTKLVILKLIGDGIRMRSIRSVEMGWCLLVRSKPLLLFLSFILLFFCFMTDVHIAWSSVLAAFFVTYFFAGMMKLGLNSTRFRMAILAPAYLVWLTGISLLGLTGFKSNDWVRTKRS